MRKYDCKRVISNLYGILAPKTVTKLVVRTVLCAYFLQEHLHEYYSVHLFFLSFFFFYVKKFEQFKGMSKIVWG